MTNIAANLAAARDLINDEIGKQIAMWGVSNERADAEEGQLFFAGFSQLEALADRYIEGEWPTTIPELYPEGWAGFRDYGSDVANIAVGVAFLTNEIARKIGNGESTYRRPRDLSKEVFGTDQPYVNAVDVPSTISDGVVGD